MDAYYYISLIEIYQLQYTLIRIPCINYFFFENESAKAKLLKKKEIVYS